MVATHIIKTDIDDANVYAKKLHLLEVERHSSQYLECGPSDLDHFVHATYFENLNALPLDDKVLRSFISSTGAAFSLHYLGQTLACGKHNILINALQT